MDEIKQNKDGLNINLQNTELHQFTGMARVQMFVSTVMSVLGMILAVIVVGGIVACIAFVGWSIYQDNQAQQSTKTNGKPVSKPVAPQKSMTLSQWRQLAKGQTPAEVRAILGEPKHIDGGAFSNWTYSSGGSVTFYQERLDSWNEPR
jgi:flagellar biosynthesis component FlhA